MYYEFLLFSQAHQLLKEYFTNFQLVFHSNRQNIVAVMRIVAPLVKAELNQQPLSAIIKSLSQLTSAEHGNSWDAGAGWCLILGQGNGTRTVYCTKNMKAEREISD